MGACELDKRTNIYAFPTGDPILSCVFYGNVNSLPALDVDDGNLPG